MADGVASKSASLDNKCGFIFVFTHRKAVAINMTSNLNTKKFKGL